MNGSSYNKLLFLNLILLLFDIRRPGEELKVLSFPYFRMFVYFSIACLLKAFCKLQNP